MYAHLQHLLVRPFQVSLLRYILLVSVDFGLEAADLGAGVIDLAAEHPDEEGPVLDLPADAASAGCFHTRHSLYFCWVLLPLSVLRCWVFWAALVVVVIVGCAVSRIWPLSRNVYVCTSGYGLRISKGGADAWVNVVKLRGR